MEYEQKADLNIRTKKLREILEKAFEQEKLEYDSIHPSYNIRNTRNDDENLFVTCYIEKHEPYNIHIDNRLELEKWVIDIVIMNPELTVRIIDKLESDGFKTKRYNGECYGEFEGHVKLLELDKNTSYNEIKDINVKLLKLFQ